MKLSNIAILATGGTIAGVSASSLDAIAYQSAVNPIETLINAVPEIAKAANIVHCEQIAQIGSENMSDDVWLRLAKRANDLLTSDDINGIVITHGTDTMEETAYFLNLVIKSEKPVVLVGAMRPGTAISADGPMNLYDVVSVAASPSSKGRGVMIVMNDTIHGARAATKTNTMLPNAFGNNDFGAMGYVLAGKPYFHNNPVHLHTVNTAFDVSALMELPQVEIVYSHAGTPASIAVNAFVKAGAKGIIHAGTGNGSIHAETLPALREAQQNGVVIVRASRIDSGIVARKDGDFIASGSLNPQKARILLQLILTKYSNPGLDEIQALFDKY